MSTPSTDEVRDAWTWERCLRRGRDPEDDTRRYREAFDAWLAAHDAEVLASVHRQRVMSDVAPTSALTARSRAAIKHYREQAITLRRSAAATRATAFHLDDDTRVNLCRLADERDAVADTWDALAAELETFEAEPAEHPDQGDLFTDQREEVQPP